MKKMILIAEDSSTQLERLKYILERNSYKVYTASNGKIALDQLTNITPDLIISDVMMPQINGYQFCKAVKTNPATKEIPFILLTSLTDPHEVINGIQAGADNFLTKPYNEDFLIERIKNILKNRELRKLSNGNSESVKIIFRGEQYEINADSRQIVDLLLSSYENTIQKNDELLHANRRLLKTQQELKKNISELERSNKELEQFAYVASHDLQEPVRMISNFAELLKKRTQKDLDEKSQLFLDQLLNASGRIHKLINDLLIFSRTTRTIENFTLVDLNNIISQVLEDLSVQINETKANIKYPEMPCIKGDPVQINQLFQNLISNALKYVRNEKPEIEIDFANSGNMTRVSIKDNGIGIERNYFEKIFVIFQRLHSNEEYPGTGIGLSICKKIVDNHGGNIWLDSEPGKGSTFYFTLPAN